MKIIEQSHEILCTTINPLTEIERAGRTCYKSENNITTESDYIFVDKLLRNNHHAMIEFADMTVRFVTNRGVTHELVRHRLCSFAQESTRYVKYDGEMEFIKPVWLDVSDDDNSTWRWKKAMSEAERNYQTLLANGWQPQQAREVLPNSLKTEIVVKANLREWRHIFSLRCSKKAHPQMRSLMLPLLDETSSLISTIFSDLWHEHKNDI